MRSLTAEDLGVAAIIGIGSCFGAWYLLHDLNFSAIAGLVAMLFVIFCLTFEIFGIASFSLCAIVLITYYDPEMNRGIAIGFFSGVIYAVSHGMVELYAMIKQDLKNNDFD